MATWENNRENERRKLLLEEAELKQKDGVWIDTKNRKSSFIDKWISRWALLMFLLCAVTWQCRSCIHSHIVSVNMTNVNRKAANAGLKSMEYLNSTNC